MINVLSLIPYGENNRISKKELMAKTKLNEQQLMEEIQKIRVKDFVKKNSGIPKALEKYKVAQKEFLEKKKAEKQKENRCKGKVRQRN